MPHHKRTLFLALVLGLSVVTAWPGLKTGDSLPDLAAQHLEGALPADVKGKVVLLDFWASWCVPCAESFPAMEQLHNTYKNQGLVIIAVSIDEKKAAMEKFLKKHSVSFPVVRDAAQKLVALADAPTMPTSFLFGRDGKVRFLHEGYKGESTRKQLIAEIEKLLKETP